MKRLSFFLASIVLLLFFLYLFPDFTHASQTVVEGVSVSRIVPLTIKVAFMGPYFDPEIINVTALKSMLPEKKVCRILSDNKVTGVVYEFRYEFLFIPSSFRTRFIKYLKSIEERVEVKNPWFYIFEYEEDWFVTKPSSVLAVLYDAKKVEKWLMENLHEIGGLPENGYMMIIADLRDGLPSATYEDIRNFLTARTLGFPPPKVEAHYYKVNYVDLDRGYNLRYREFAIGWGGSNRLWFLDLSAGPTFVSMWYDLPIQVVMKDQSINPYTSAGSQWLTEYLSDYIWEFIYNLVTPDFVYDPPWSEKFTIKIVIIDCRSDYEKIIVPIGKTLNPILVKEVVSTLLPLSKVDVEVKFLNITDFPELNDLLKKFSGRLDSWMHKYLFLSPMNESYIDAQPIYEYIKDNIDIIMPRVSEEENEYIIPVVAFAFSQDYHFMFKYKWIILRRSPEANTVWGAALKEMVLIGLSQKDFLFGDYTEPKQEGKGFGFTQTIIHEVGHMLGLPHPHVYGDINDFVSSAMSYFSYEYCFSTFDKDALARIHIDKIVMKTGEIIYEIERQLPLKLNMERKREVVDRINEIKKMLNEVDSEYSRMNYLEAWRIALDANKMARKLAEIVEALPHIPENIMEIFEEREIEIRQLNQNYSTLLSEYNRLMERYNYLLLGYKVCEGELNFFKSLTVALLVLICLFALAMATIYIVKRKTSYRCQIIPRNFPCGYLCLQYVLRFKLFYSLIKPL